MKIKMLKKWFAIPLVVCVFLTFTLGLSPEYNYRDGLSEEEKNGVAMYSDSFLNNMGKSQVMYQKLLISFAPNGELSSDGLLSSTDYPDYFGGAYINDDGILAINITSEYYSRVARDRIIDSLQGVMGSKNFVVSECKYSYGYLTMVMDKMNAKQKYNISKESPPLFSKYSILDDKNRIRVVLNQLNEKNIQLFKNEVYDDACIEFVQSESPITPIATDMYCGGAVVANNSIGSMAYRARRAGKDGIITAAHVCKSTASGSNTVQYGSSSTIMGYCRVRQYSGSVDAAFVEVTNSSFKPTNKILLTANTLSTTCENPGKGTVVYRASRGGSASGKITDTNATVSNGTVILTNVTEAQFVSAAGDSGGLVYNYNSSRNTVGIMQSISGSKSYYTKATLANSALSASRY
jgi:streptogrisin B